MTKKQFIEKLDVLPDDFQMLFEGFAYGKAGWMPSACDGVILNINPYAKTITCKGDSDTVHVWR